MKIRAATVNDAEIVSGIIRSFSEPFFTSPDGKGAEAFLKSISENAIAEYIASDNFSYYVGEEHGKIVGAIAIRDNKHLYHLFVVSVCQHRGLGRQFWEHARAEAIVAGHHGEFTVNSSLNAVSVYKAFGFKPASDIRQADGVSFLPMVLAGE